MPALKFGIVLPYGDARKTAALAKLAEDTGWDGIFVGDAIWCLDPLIQLAACAMTTSRIRLGTEVLATPLRRPWHLASESAAIDIMSDGRLILGLGMGATWMGWKGFPDNPANTKARAEMLDETIDILTQMHQCKQFDYDGKHYHIKLSLVEPMHYPPKTVQQPRIPIWVPGVWLRTKSMNRILKCDGVFPTKMNSEGKFEEITPADVKEMKAFVDANRTLTTPFDIIQEGSTNELSRAEAQDKLGMWVEAGATWWIESTWGKTEEQIKEIMQKGVPELV